MHTNVGELPRADLTVRGGKSDGSLSQRWLPTSHQLSLFCRLLIATSRADLARVRQRRDGWIEGQEKSGVGPKRLEATNARPGFREEEACESSRPIQLREPQNIDR